MLTLMCHRVVRFEYDSSLSRLLKECVEFEFKNKLQYIHVLHTKNNLSTNFSSIFLLTFSKLYHVCIILLIIIIHNILPIFNYKSIKIP